MNGNRRAKVYVSMEHIARLINLPDGVRPVFVYASSDPPGAYLIIESEAFPDQPIDTGLPTVLGAHTTVARVVVDGREYTAVDVLTTAQEMAKNIPAPWGRVGAESPSA